MKPSRFTILPEGTLLVRDPDTVTNDHGDLGHCARKTTRTGRK